MVEVIGKKDHGGRVCGIGRGFGLRLFFGSSSKSEKMRQKKIAELVYKRLKEKMEEKLKEKFEETMHERI